MEPSDLHVKIGARDKNGHVPLRVRLYAADGTPFDSEAFIYIPVTRLANPEINPSVPATISRQILAHVQEARQDPTWADFVPFRVLLEIEPLDLVGLDWEHLISLAPATASVAITRFNPVSDMRAVSAFELPLRLLHIRPLAGLQANPTDAAMCYFPYHRVTGLTDSTVVSVIREARCDIVHLVCDAGWHSQGLSELTIEPAEGRISSSIRPAILNRALSTCRARLLILQCVQENSVVAALNFAQRLSRLGGPSTVVLQGATDRFLDDFYMCIVHDGFGYLGWLTQSSPAARTAVLFHAIGGDRVMALRPWASRLSQDMERTAATAARLLTGASVRGERQPLPGTGVLDAANIRELATFLSREEPTRTLAGIPISWSQLSANFNIGEFGRDLLSHDEAAQRVYDYSRETGAWLPLARDRRTQDRTVAQLETLQRAMDRVVNVGLGDEKFGPVDARQNLELGKAYQLSVQIGRRADWSVVDGGAAFPEHTIERYYSPEGIELRVVVSAPTFEVNQPDRSLFLQRPPAESGELQFAIRAPMVPGSHRIRVCIYRELNLLQSVLVHVGVGNPENPSLRGVTAEVEFALSATLGDIEVLPKRELNLLTNAADDGTHTLVVTGTTLRETFDFGDSEMRAMVDAAREALFKVAADSRTQPPRYRFDETSNAATLIQLAEDTIELAQLGYPLYVNIITGKSREFATALKESLGVAGATIQVAAVKSARYVFPWSLVYDHPLVTGNLKFCPQFAADAVRQPATPASTWLCLDQGCPYYGKVDFVCPSGFWGFKHLIEQPLSVNTDANGSGKRDLIREIDGGATGTNVSALMVVSRELQQVGAHVKELCDPTSFAFAVKDTKIEAGEWLKDPQRAAHMVYFYCHGGREKTSIWLGIGSGVKERLIPSDLQGLQIDWTDSHPLVFINGCHTADFKPDDLLNFNQVLAYCRAAGVIGTEISVPESLARFAARSFMSQFRSGVTVGTTLRELRWALLEKFNLLGLAYTPYCSMDLKVVQH